MNFENLLTIMVKIFFKLQIFVYVLNLLNCLKFMVFIVFTQDKHGIIILPKKNI